MTEDGVSRRTLLKAGSGAMAATGVGLLGLGHFGGGTDAATRALGPEESRALAETYAPVLSFDANEQWFPTDPRPYTSETDEGTVVDGFDALDGYTAAARDEGAPPAPTVFYNARQYADSPLAVVQFWLYSAFDQFTTNFHWHDWEVIHVFVDRETETPQLFVASAHSRAVPNNEFLDPAVDRPRVLPELGSHSSGLSLNERLDSFQRLPIGDTIADITNRTLEGVDVVADLPIAYGLPRDEGTRLPFLVPELDGAPLHEDARLPSVDRTSLLDPSLTVDSLTGLAAPPADLPSREPGPVFAPEAAGEVDADVSYDLAPTADLEHIQSFVGPQLSFEFSVPAFLEDAVAGHITTTKTPWAAPRYENPAADITDPAHRATLADRYAAIAQPEGLSLLVAAVSRTVQADDAPDGGGVTTTSSSVETVALVESDPVAVPTFGGVVAAQGLPAGDHRLTVNGAGYAPHSERVTVDDSDRPNTAGVGGEVPLTAAEDAVKLRVDPDGTDADLAALAVEDDFGGRLYDAPLDGRDAVYVNRNGAYATEVRDTDGALGVFRVNPARDASEATIAEPRTGKGAIAGYVADLAGETAREVSAVGDEDDEGEEGGPPGGSPPGLARALTAVAEAAESAAARAAADEGAGADRQLRAASQALSTVAERFAESRGDLPTGLGNAVERRLDQAGRRVDQALAAEKL